METMPQKPEFVPEPDDIEIPLEEGLKILAAQAEDVALTRANQARVAKARMKYNPYKKPRCPTCGQVLGVSLVVKQCSRCREDVPISLFFKDNRAQDGLRSSCKACDKELRTIYHSEHPHRLWAQGVLASRKQYGFKIKTTFLELEALAKVTEACNCGRQFDWSQGSLSVEGRRNDYSPHLVAASKIITLKSIRIMCKVCAKLFWGRIALSEKEVDLTPRIIEQAPTDGVVTKRLSFLGDAE